MPPQLLPGDRLLAKQNSFHVGPVPHREFAKTFLEAKNFAYAQDKQFLIKAQALVQQLVFARGSAYRFFDLLQQDHTGQTLEALLAKQIEAECQATVARSVLPEDAQ